MVHRVIAAAFAVVFATALLYSPALAGGWGKRGHYGYGQHGGHYKGGYRYKHHGGGDEALFLIGGLIGGLVLGQLLYQPRYRAPQPSVTYTRVEPRFTHCKATTGTGYRQGREALFGGTMCYDQAGGGHIVNESVRFIRNVR